MKLENHFAVLVEERLKALGTNAFAVEKANGLPADAIRNVLRSSKKSGPTLTRVEEICRALGLEIYIGPSRSGHELASPIDEGEFASVPVHQAEASAGPGMQAFDADPIGSLAFQRSWLAQLNVSPTRAGIVRVRGDSMEPTIRCGSIALIDEQRSNANGKVFAFVEEGELRIKRLTRANDHVLAISSDNPRYPLEHRHGHGMNAIRILGEVVWTAYNWREDPKLRMTV